MRASFCLTLAVVLAIFLVVPQGAVSTPATFFAYNYTYYIANPILWMGQTNPSQTIGHSVVVNATLPFPITVGRTTTSYWLVDMTGRLMLRGGSSYDMSLYFNDSIAVQIFDYIAENYNGEGIFISTEGVHPTRTWIVTWIVDFYLSEGHLTSFQIQFQEMTNYITFVYNYTNPVNYGLDSSAGVGSFGGSYVYTICYNAECLPVQLSYQLTGIPDAGNVVPMWSDCPGNITAYTPATNSTAYVSWVPPSLVTSTDFFVNVTLNYPNPSFFPVGATAVTYSAGTFGGYVGTCTFYVNVIDNVPPVTNCPANMGPFRTNLTYQNTSYQCWPIVNATDNVDGSISYSLITTSPYTYLFCDYFSIGVNTITMHYTDSSHNNASCSFNITVVDGVAPRISSVPSNMQKTVTAPATSIVITWKAVVYTDNVGVTYHNQTVQSGYAFPLGLTTVTFYAQDAALNYATASFNVTVTQT